METQKGIAKLRLEIVKTFAYSLARSYEKEKNDNLLSTFINEPTIPNWTEHLALINELRQAILLDKSQYNGILAEKRSNLKS